MKDMLFLPLIPISGGSVVHIGCETRGIEILSQEPDILRDIVIPLHKTYDIPLIMDMDGVLSYDPQIKLLKNIAKSFPIWFDGGARFSDDVIDFFVANVEICCISTKNIDSIEEMENAVALSEQLCLMLDTCKGELISHSKELRNMSLKDLRELAEELGIEKLAYVDYGELMDTCLETDTLAPLLEGDFELYVAGLNPAKVDSWRELGIKGLLLYYKTIFDFQRRKHKTKEEELYTLAPEESRTRTPDPHAFPA